MVEARDLIEVSIGDYILSGGEIAALAVLDVCVRLIPGVMGKAELVPDRGMMPADGGAMPLGDPHGDRTPTARSIVVGVDGSVHARFALKWAADEAKRRDLPLRVLFGQISEVKNVPAWYGPGVPN